MQAKSMADAKAGPPGVEACYFLALPLHCITVRMMLSVMT
jgi:hypothetical protein